MSIEFDRDAALAKMPMCGNCSNLKLVVWAADAELKGAAAKYVIKPLGIKTFQVMVRCNWLKTAIEQPDRLCVCDGWRDVNSPPEQRSGSKSWEQ